MSKLVHQVSAVLFDPNNTNIKTKTMPDDSRVAWVPSSSQDVVSRLRLFVDNPKLTKVIEDVASCFPAWTFRVYDDVVEYRIHSSDGEYIDEGVLTD